MTLSDILGRDVSLEWHEAVALVRGVVERLLEKSSQAIAVPELDQIEISSAGQVSVSGGTNAGEPVRRLGQLLQAMLGYSESPVQLRLVVVQATAPAPAFGSIREYDEAVGYFERPGRDAVLQALYARAAAAPVRSDSQSAFPRWTLSLRCRRQIGPRNQGKTPLRNRTRVAGSSWLALSCCSYVSAAWDTRESPASRRKTAKYQRLRRRRLTRWARPWYLVFRP